MHFVLVALIQCGALACYQVYTSPPMTLTECLNMRDHYQVPPDFRAKSSVNCNPAPATTSK